MNDSRQTDSRRNFFRALLIALVLIGGFCAYVLYLFLAPQLSLAKQKRTLLDLESSSSALEAYRDVHGGYPSGDWERAARILVEGGWLDKAPLRDHWKNPLVYEPTQISANSLAAGYTLTSCGEDDVCEDEHPSTVEFDHADYSSDIVIQDGAWRRAPFSAAGSEAAVD